MKSLEKAGRKIEQATKGNDTETPPKPVEKPKVIETTEKTESQTPKMEEQHVEAKPLTIEEKAETTEPEKPNEGSLEVTIKIKTPKKKKKIQD